MSNKPIEIPLVGNATKFVAATKDASKALEHVEGDLKDVARQGDKATDSLEQDFRDAARKIDRSLDAVGTSSKRNFGKARESAKEFKGEAVQNLGEVASSFDGSVSGIVDGFQGLAGGASVALLGLGGVAGGVGIGLAALGLIGGTFAQQWADSAEETEQRISDMYADMLESGQDYLSQDYINQQLGTLYEDQDKYNEAVKTAKTLHLDLQTVLIAEVTAGEERNTVLERAEQLRLAALEHVKTGASYTDAEAAAANGTVATTAKIVDHYQTLNGEQADAASKAGQIKAAQDQVNASYAEAEDKTGKTADNVAKLAATKVPPINLSVDKREVDKALDDIKGRAKRGFSVTLHSSNYGVTKP